MSRLRAVFSFSMLFAILFSGFAISPQSQAVAQESDVTSAGFVSGPWRVMVLQTVVGDEIAEAGLAAPEQGTWAIAIADVTNTGVTGPFDPAMLQLGTSEDSPLVMTDGVAADVAGSVSASQALGLEGVTAEGTFPVNENGTIRMAVAIHLAEAPSDGESLVLRLNDQVMSVSNTVVDALAVDQLPDLVPEMQLEIADVDQLVGNSSVEVRPRAGGAELVKLAGVQTPSTGADKGCFVPESANATMTLTGGVVWMESVPGTHQKLMWFNNPATGSFGLLNSELIAQGYAGVSETSTPYTSWLSAVHEYVQGQGTGLWSACRDAAGTWINQPTPTPVPTQSPEQVRAEYQWIDARDLIIRPGNFQGEKIAISGSVFNIQVEGNQAIMQIWVDGGNYDAVIVYYEGDTTGIYEGTWISVYAVGAGTLDITNAYGAQITQPLVRADIIDK